MRFFTTKWLTTRGIVEFEGTVHPPLESGAQYVSGDGVHARLDVEAFPDLLAAEARAEVVARRNVEAKRKALARAEALWTRIASGDVKVVRMATAHASTEGPVTQ